LGDIHGEHGGVAQHEPLETGISGGRGCGDIHGVAGILTLTALLAVVSVMCGKPGPSRGNATPAWVARSVRAVSDSDDKAVARRDIRRSACSSRQPLLLKTARITGDIALDSPCSSRAGRQLGR
jgi:hypothetical protein